MKNHFDCYFHFELIEYICKVDFIIMEPWPQFHVTQTDPSLIEKYGMKQIFFFEHGNLTWKASRKLSYDGYLKTSIALALLECIQKM